MGPPHPELNDVVSYDSKWLMDGGVVLEPLVGNRVYHSLACLDRTMGQGGRQCGENGRGRRASWHSAPLEVAQGLRPTGDQSSRT